MTLLVALDAGSDFSQPCSRLHSPFVLPHAIADPNLVGVPFSGSNGIYGLEQIRLGGLLLFYIDAHVHAGISRAVSVLAGWQQLDERLSLPQGTKQPGIPITLLNGHGRALVLHVRRTFEVGTVEVLEQRVIVAVLRDHREVDEDLASVRAGPFTP